MLLHKSKEFDDNLRDWSDKDLSLSGFLGVEDALESVSEDLLSDHFLKGGLEPGL